MRIPLLICLMVCSSVVALAQSQSENPQAPNDSLGRPLKTDSKGKADTTAPLTKPEPAASPQGETPPGNMAAPDGSSKPVKPKEEAGR